VNSYGPAAVCLLTSVHGPFDGRIFQKEAKSLVEAGYQVTIVAPHLEGVFLDGVQIKAVPVPGSRLERMSVTLWRVFRAALETNATVFHFHDPELIPVGLLLKLVGKRVIYDVHEDVPRDIMDKDWIAPVLRRPIARAAGYVESIAASRFDAIVAATPTIARSFPKQKTLTVQNFVHFDVPFDSGAFCYKDRKPFIAYVGGISEFRGAREMISAMGLLRNGASGARLRLAGWFDPPGFQGELANLPGWSRVDFVGWLSPVQIRELLGKSRLGLVLLHPIENHKLAQPTKLFEYMAAGLPIVASDFPLWRSIIQEAGCGLLVDPLKPDAIAEAIRWLLDNPAEAEAMGQRGREAAVRTYNWESEKRKLIALYARLTDRESNLLQS
jgi:glycosyltransferase involved in cell wall biosynthesis